MNLKFNNNQGLVNERIVFRNAEPCSILIKIRTCLAHFAGISTASEKRKLTSGKMPSKTSSTLSKQHTFRLISLIKLPTSPSRIYSNPLQITASFAEKMQRQSLSNYSPDVAQSTISCLISFQCWSIELTALIWKEYRVFQRRWDQRLVKSRR